MSSINWNAELAKLEREFDGLPPRPRPTPTPTEIRKRRVVQKQADKHASDLAVWARLVLVAALAGALGFWPYASECGAGLYTFIGASAMVFAGGSWVATWTWRNRLARTHVLALVLTLAGMAIVAHQVLPRVGYARVDPSNPPQWSCPAAADRANR
jgi:hypothetical protein